RCAHDELRRRSARPRGRRAGQQGPRSGGRRDRAGGGRRGAFAAGRRGAVKKKDPRHRAPEAALQILYPWGNGRHQVDRAPPTFFRGTGPAESPPPDARREFASSLARETGERLGTIDPLIADTAERWRPERMAVLDRLILRMALCEMLRDRGTPPAVVIN